MAHVFVTLPSYADKEPETFNEFELTAFGQALQNFVAEALTCDDTEGQLRPDDIEVRISQRESGNQGEELQITVLTNDFPSRRANLDDRLASLQEEIVAYPWHRRLSGSIRIILAPSAYGEF